MKTLNHVLLAIAVVTMIPATAVSQTVQCDGVHVVGSSVALARSILIPVVDFTVSGGQLHPAPLLETRINVLPGLPACVVVHFSVQAHPQDNNVVFQASIDDVPM